MASEKVGINALWKKAKESGDFDGSFADFAEYYNKNKKTVESGLDNFLDTLKKNKPAYRPDNVSDEEKKPLSKQATPTTKIMGMSPIVATGVGIVTFLVVGYGIKVFFFPKNKPQ